MFLEERIPERFDVERFRMTVDFSCSRGNKKYLWTDQAEPSLPNKDDVFRDNARLSTVAKSRMNFDVALFDLDRSLGGWKFVCFRSQEAVRLAARGRGKETPQVASPVTPSLRCFYRALADF
ncbi:hypothetical protein KM043_002668 [Ampulex compressa]|nr:hypothetical protein KM043_002668 [Ampulex compressa]